MNIASYTMCYFSLFAYTQKYFLKITVLPIETFCMIQLRHLIMWIADTIFLCWNSTPPFTQIDRVMPVWSTATFVPVHPQWLRCFHARLRPNTLHDCLLLAPVQPVNRLHIACKSAIMHNASWRENTNILGGHMSN